jgi:hypothetical protein
VSSPSPSTTASKGLAFSTFSGTAVPCSPPRTIQASGNFSRTAQASLFTRGHSVENMQATPITSASGWMRAVISSKDSPWIMKSSRSG